jgi:hypothetical protein
MTLQIPKVCYMWARFKSMPSKTNEKSFLSQTTSTEIKINTKVVFQKICSVAYTYHQDDF